VDDRHAPPHSVVTVVAYQPVWPTLAARASTQLANVLGPAVTMLEHVGSTAVPGLAAKPVLDLLAGAPDLARVQRRADDLQRLGFLLVPTGMPDRLFYRREPTGGSGSLAVHLHVVPADTWALRNERLLRDHLRAHPHLVARYGRLKTDLAAAGFAGDAYTRAKTAFVQEVVNSARRGRGLQPVPVWEE
jgi:GrpB-like predicted nucleotidyltransferase (UPF0157 family)